MTTLDTSTIGWASLCSGYGGLDEGIRAVMGGHLVVVAEHEPATAKVPRPSQAPSKVLAHRYPWVPNLGDITQIDWTPWRGRVHGLTAGFPCQDVSTAGVRAGMLRGNRSGLWFEVARAILELAPEIVIIENVPGLRSARAGDPEEATDETASELEPDDEAVGDTDNGDAGHLRGGAFRTILEDLAALGFDAEWVSLRASDVGAPHKRERVFIMAYRRTLTGITRPRGPVRTPVADEDGGGPLTEQQARERGQTLRLTGQILDHFGLLPTPVGRLGSSGPDLARSDRATTSGADDLATTVERHLLPTPNASDSPKHAGQHPDKRRAGGHAIRLQDVTEAGDLLPTPTTQDMANNGGPSQQDRNTPPLNAEVLNFLPTPLGSDGVHGGPNQRGGSGDLRISSVDLLFPTPTTEPNTGNGHARDLGGEVGLLPTPSASGNGDDADPVAFEQRRQAAAARHGNNGIGTPLGIAARTLPADGVEDASDTGELVRWGKYRAAIMRAQAALHRLAPSPTIPDGKGGKRRLAARFVEWMMMLPDGWVTAVPGITRRDQLKLLGNGVVPAQASAAALILLDRVTERLNTPTR